MLRRSDGEGWETAPRGRESQHHVRSPDDVPMTRPTRRTDLAGRYAWPEWLVIGALVIACLLLVPKLAATGRYDAAILRFPFQVDDAEGVVLAEAVLIAHGTNPYAFQPSPASYFYAGPYTPVYTLLNSGAVAVAGPTFKFGRAFQLLATLVVAGWLAWMVRRSATDWRGWMVGGWSAAIFVTAHLVAVWGVRVRPDMTALAFNALGVVILHAWLNRDDGERWRAGGWPKGTTFARIVVGAACFALGWWTKQTFVALPVAFIIATTVRRPRIGVTLAALYAGMIAVPFALVTALTQGGFAQKTVSYQGSWEWGAFRRLAQPFIERYASLIIVAVVFALLVVFRTRRPTFAVCWLALSAVGALGAGTSGGNHNHFVEFVAAAVLLVGQGIATLVAAEARDQRRAWMLPTLGALVMLGGAIVAINEHEGAAGWLARDYRAPTVAERDGLTAIANYIANSPGPVYSNNVGMLVVTGQEVRITDPFTMAAEVRLGRWDDALLVADVAAGRYPVIALSYNNVATLDPDQPPTDATPGLIRAIQTRYRLIESNVLRLYVPK